MNYHLYRDAFSEVYTYRYRLANVSGQTLFQAIWPAVGAALKPEEIFFEKSEGQRLAALKWEERGWWVGDRFHLFLTGQEQAIAVMDEHWHIVDRLLLHLPRYRVNLINGNRLDVRGSRYAERFYEIFALPAASTEDELQQEGTWLGEIMHPASGPTYTIRTDSPLLTGMPLLLLAMGVVVDLWGIKHE